MYSANLSFNVLILINFTYKLLDIRVLSIMFNNLTLRMFIHYDKTNFFVDKVARFKTFSEKCG